MLSQLFPRLYGKTLVRKLSGAESPDNLYLTVFDSCYHKVKTEPEKTPPLNYDLHSHGLDNEDIPLVIDSL